MAAKYYVFKITEDGGVGEPVNDAIVIRKQDVFAAPALAAYANAIGVAIQTTRKTLAQVFQMSEDDVYNEPLNRLQSVADFFHEEAEDAAATTWKKLPD